MHPLPEGRRVHQETYFLPLIEGITHKASQAGYQVVLSLANNFNNNICLFDGIILDNLQTNHLFLESIEKARVPMVINGTPNHERGEDFFFVDIDNIAAAFQMLLEIINKKRIKPANILIPAELRIRETT